MGKSEWDACLEVLIAGQKERLLRLAREWVPRATAEDILQPNDFPELEGNPWFRYEEGVLSGMQAVQTALRAKRPALAKDHDPLH